VARASDRSCWHCEAHPLALTAIRSPYRYEGDVRRLVGAFKFHGFSALSGSLAAPMVDCLARERLAVEVAVPVPLHGSRLRQRGYNQALLLGRGVAAGLDLPLVEALRRRRSVPAQVGAGAGERWLHVKGAFEVRRGAAVAGRSVLLIDDVATTGATLDACARALLAAGARSVSALTFARED
jgi:competence protein ComFC